MGYVYSFNDILHEVVYEDFSQSADDHPSGQFQSQ
jgi:hypothetical protein